MSQLWICNYKGFHLHISGFQFYYRPRRTTAILLHQVLFKRFGSFLNIKYKMRWKFFCRLNKNSGNTTVSLAALNNKLVDVYLVELVKRKTKDVDLTSACIFKIHHTLMYCIEDGKKSVFSLLSWHHTECKNLKESLMILKKYGNMLISLIQFLLINSKIKQDEVKNIHRTLALA